MSTKVLINQKWDQPLESFAIEFEEIHGIDMDTFKGEAERTEEKYWIMWQNGRFLLSYLKRNDRYCFELISVGPCEQT